MINKDDTNPELIYKYLQATFKEGGTAIGAFKDIFGLPTENTAYKHLEVLKKTEVFIKTKAKMVQHLKKRPVREMVREKLEHLLAAYSYADGKPKDLVGYERILDKLMRMRN